MRDPKMPLQNLLVTERQLECSNVQARHTEENKHEVKAIKIQRLIWSKLRRVRTPVDN